MSRGVSAGSARVFHKAREAGLKFQMGKENVGGSLLIPSQLNMAAHGDFPACRPRIVKSKTEG
jgi:hypothetical protein